MSSLINKDTIDDIYDAIDEVESVAETLVKDTVGWSGKNKLPLTVANLKAWNTSGTWAGNVYTINNGTIEVLTDNADNVTGLKVNGTFNATTYFQLSNERGGQGYEFLELNTQYYINGGDTNIGVRAYHYNGTTNAASYGTDESFTLSAYPSNANIDVILSKDIAYSNAVFYPMIRLASISDPTFEPYHATVDEVKADKVTNATSGHLAGLDSNGNLTDSGVSPTEEVTVEGNPVTFESPFEQDAKSVVVNVKPIQDLHGYDHPWVGGTGKNKLLMTVASIKALNTSGTWAGNVYTISGVTFTVLTDSDGNNVTGIKVISGTASANIFFEVGRIIHDDIVNSIINGCPSGGVLYSTYQLNVLDSSDGNTIAEDIGNGANIDASRISGNLRAIIRINNGYSIPANGLLFSPMIRLATETDATFAPYSNICPISGIDEVKIPLHGKNFFPDRVTDYVWGENASGTYEKSGDTIKVTTAANNSFSGAFSELGYVDADLSGVYTYSFDIKSNLQSAQAMVGFTGFGRKTVNITNEWQRISITTTFNGTHGAFAVYSGDNTAKEIYIKNLQIESGSNSTPYEPYKGSTTTIPLPSTLYDADVDVTEGSVDGTKDKIVLDGSDDEGWGYYDGVFYCDFPNAKLAQVVPTSNWLKGVSNRDYTLLNDGEFAYNRVSAGNANFRLDSITSLADWKTHLASNPLEVCYELATPTTLSFDPTDVELLEGTNVVSTNAEKVAVTYKAGILATLGDIDDVNDKVKTKLDKKDVAKVEGANASKPYAVGDYMLRSDGFYRVTASIESGAAITSNNTSKTTIGNELTNFSGRYVPITDFVLGQNYYIDDTNISAFVVSIIKTSGTTYFIMPATYVDTSKIITDRQLFCEFSFDSQTTDLEMSIGCSFERQSNGQINIFMNDIDNVDVSIGYFTKY